MSLRTPLGWLAAASILVMASAGCGGAAPPAPSNTGPSAAPASRPAVASPISGSAAGPASVSAAAGAPIRIGLLEPLTGTQAGQGKDNMDGLNLFLTSNNSTIAGRKLDISAADTQANADVGLTKSKQLVENNHVQLLMGVSATPVCYALATYVKQVQVPFMITVNCAAQDILTDPKYKSEYVSRYTVNNGDFAAAAEWLYNQGYRKASIWATDFAAGHEFADMVSAAFIEMGGSVVQIQYPAIGTQDFGPLLAQMSPQADVAILFLIGTDGLRFAQQFASYAGAKKPQMFDTANITGGENLDTLKDSIVGWKASNYYSQAIDTPMNHDFVRAFQAKYPGRSISGNVAEGYMSGQVLQAALQKVNGDIEDKQKFLNALYATDIDVVKGHIKLDANHDVVQNEYMYQVVREPSGGYGHQILYTAPNVTAAWKFTPQQIAKLQIGKNAYQWTSMEKAKLNQAING